jgi:uncharacterized protein (TIGR02246 family)
MTTANPADGVYNVIEAVYDAWADNDADAFAALYTDDATVVQPGIHKKNKEDIRTTMAADLRPSASHPRETGQREVTERDLDEPLRALLRALAEQFCAWDQPQRPPGNACLDPHSAARARVCAFDHPESLSVPAAVGTGSSLEPAVRLMRGAQIVRHDCRCPRHARERPALV